MPEDGVMPNKTQSRAAEVAQQFGIGEELVQKIENGTSLAEVMRETYPQLLEKAKRSHDIGELEKIHDGVPKRSEAWYISRRRWDELAEEELDGIRGFEDTLRFVKKTRPESEAERCTFERAVCFANDPNYHHPRVTVEAKSKALRRALRLT